MFWIEIIVFCLLIVILFYVVEFIKTYKENHWSIKCGACGSLDTVIKHNDSLESAYTFSRFFGIRQGQGNKKVVVHNPPTFYCNDCKKEYSCRYGVWIKKNGKERSI